MLQPRKGEVVQLATADAVTPGANLQMAQLNETLAETNKHLANIANVGADTLAWVKKAAWWAVLIVGGLWPAVGKVISGLPPLPG